MLGLACGSSYVGHTNKPARDRSVIINNLSCVDKLEEEEIFDWVSKKENWCNARDKIMHVVTQMLSFIFWLRAISNYVNYVK